MPKLPAPQHSTAESIYQWHKAQHAKAPAHRKHLGASVIGHECKRHIWYVFRWALSQQFDGRMLRLFDTGKREEVRVLDELRAIGCQVWATDEHGQQFTVSACDGHFGGSMDGVVQRLPEAPEKFHLFECKTHNDKSYKELLKKGIPARHRWQMQAYMSLADLPAAVYVAVNKDTDDIYVERVKSDAYLWRRVVETAEYVIQSPEPPPRIADDAEHFVCKMCPFVSICHGNKLPEVNCRTCAHSTPVEAGQWRCEQQARITDGTACDAHVYIPALVAKHLTLESAESNGAVTWRINESGKTIAQPPYKSADLRNVDGGIVLGEPFIKDMVSQGARIHALKDDLPWEATA